MSGVSFPILGIAGAANGSGKSTLACRILEAFRGRFHAVKSITVYPGGPGGKNPMDGVKECGARMPGYCPTHEHDCACRRLDGPFAVVEDEETIRMPGTDTGRFVRAGARSVLWGLAREGSHAALWQALARRLPFGEPVLCEGSRILEPARPQGVVFVLDPSISRRRWKSATEENLIRANWVVINRRPEAPADPEILAWLDRVRSQRRIEVDLSTPLARWPDPRLADWVARWLAAVESGG